MSLLFEIKESPAAGDPGQCVTAAGYDGEVIHLQIPDRIDGLPVRGIAPWAFANRAELEYVSLPDTLRTLDRFAFYSCRNLKKVLLGDGIVDYGDGVFRQCHSLSEIELRLADGHFDILREILSDTDRTLRFILHLPDGEACLTFPDYLAEYEEDTRARQMHYHIEGIGFSYRECVSRAGIDFRSYDRLFSRIRMDEQRQAAQIAMDRLLYPYALTEEAGGLYRDFLREHAEGVLHQAIENHSRDWLIFLTEERLAGPESLDPAIRYASEKREPEYVSILMRALREEGGRPASSPMTFVI